MCSAATSGGLGDIVFAIPVMKKLGVTDVHVKLNYYFPPYGNLYLAIKSLLHSQGFNVHSTPGGQHPGVFQEGLHIDYNLDHSLSQRCRGKNHIIISYLNTFNLPHDNWKDPWLHVTGPSNIVGDYTLIHLTDRWRMNSRVDWKKVLRSIEGKVYFTGFQHEWLDFCTKYGDVEWLPTNDILSMAILIRDCKALYCNQSVSLALAQAIGKDYYLERKPGKTNCLMYTQNEHIL